MRATFCDEFVKLAESPFRQAENWCLQAAIKCLRGHDWMSWCVPSLLMEQTWLAIPGSRLLWVITCTAEISESSLRNIRVQEGHFKLTLGIIENTPLELWHSYSSETMQRQSLTARYVDLQKLVRLLREAFGRGNFEIDTQVCLAARSR